MEESGETVRQKKTNAVELSARQAYIKLKQKYEEQKKMIKMLTAEEKFEIKEQFSGIAVGRKRKYTPQRIKNKIIEYFAKMKATNRPPTKSGLMVHLKMHRDQFYQYASYPEFKDIMEQTAGVIENWYEEALILNKYSASGIQFALKNRFGWTDQVNIKQEVVLDERQLIAKIESMAPELAALFSTAGQLKMLENSSPVTDCEIIEDKEENLDEYLRLVNK